jgi:uncharacterized protein (TIGR03435 family)
MIRRLGRNCDFAGGILLVAAGSVASVGQTQLPAVRSEFEVASVKPNVSERTNFLMRPPVEGRFTATNVTLKLLIALAYQVREHEIFGGPAWIGSDRYDVAAKAAEGNVSTEQSRVMIQRMLEDRFALKVHREKNEMPIFTLVPAKNGLKIAEAREGSCVAMPQGTPAPGQGPTPFCGRIILLANGIAGKKMTMAQLANSLSGIVGPPVIDKTGYVGYFDFQLEFSRELTSVQANSRPADDRLATPIDNSEPSIFSALQEQLGMKLEATKGPVEVLVVDNAAKASAN